MIDKKNNKPTNRIFSGIQPTGNLHLGNYLGAIRNWVTLQDRFESIYCVVDLHAITVPQDPELVRSSTREVAASLIVAGISTERSILFNQSCVPQHAELAWIFNCTARLGWLNRMTQFKEKAGKHRENATVGLYAYPNLMAADILMFKATKVPVGRDQKQHMEMTRDIAQRFNHRYGDILVIPDAEIDENTAVLGGLDGRKMSKSYNNIIPLFADEKQLRKLVMKIKTNSLEPGAPKDTDGSTLFEIYKAFATDTEIQKIEERYADGIGWGEMKQVLFDYINDHVKPARDEYNRLIADPAIIEQELLKGAERARELSIPYLEEIRRAVGIRKLSPI